DERPVSGNAVLSDAGQPAPLQAIHGNRRARRVGRPLPERRLTVQALVWKGINQLGDERVPDPSVLNPKDIIVKVAMSSVCGSDLHLIGGYVPAMKPGDILGHEFLGEIVETGRDVTTLKTGDRVVVASIL